MFALKWHGRQHGFVSSSNPVLSPDTDRQLHCSDNFFWIARNKTWLVTGFFFVLSINLGDVVLYACDNCRFWCLEILVPLEDLWRIIEFLFCCFTASVISRAGGDISVTKILGQNESESRPQIKFYAQNKFRFMHLFISYQRILLAVCRWPGQLLPDLSPRLASSSVTRPGWLTFHMETWRGWSHCWRRAERSCCLSCTMLHGALTPLSLVTSSARRPSTCMAKWVDLFAACN